MTKDNWKTANPADDELRPAPELGFLCEVHGLVGLMGCSCQFYNRKLCSDLTEEQKLEAARIGRVQFISAGTRRVK